MVKQSRTIVYRDKFVAAFADVKEKYGYGVYSYTEGMTRRAARKIARNIARRAVRAR